MPQEPNPILDPSFRIPFDRIHASHVAPGVRELLAEARDEVERLAADTSPPSWQSVVAPLDRIMDRVERGTVPVRHLLAVAESPELREAWGEVLPEVTRFWSSLHLHEGLWFRVKAFAATEEARTLRGLTARHLQKTLRDFQRSGADLGPGERERLEELDVELACLEQSFSENVLDATAAYSLLVTDEEKLSGIPADARERFRKRATDMEQDGWQITLDQPAFEAVVTYAEDRGLREELHGAYYSRCAGDSWDNRPLIPRILGLRRERALLLGYADFPDFRLEEHMVRTGARARDFIAEVANRTRPYWRRDLKELEAYAEQTGIRPMEPWDVAFLVERLRQERYDLNEEELRPYFPLDQALSGLFEITRRLFGLEVAELAIEEVWHPDVRYYELRDARGVLLGGFYTDFFPRPEKRQGAWMHDFIHGEPLEGGGCSPHLGVICANFPPPTEERPALLTHRDVQTLFHEFGHLLHHLTSRVPISRRGGIHVAWDFVELPSQLLENWTWEREPLDLFARHWETGESLPEALFQRMHRARRFMGGWRQMRQLGFGAFDLALHTGYDEARDGDPIEWVARVLEPFSPNADFARRNPLTFFAHIFSGGYAAAYYSYLWSETLEADLFTRFLERGVFDAPTGTAYLDTILSAGDSEEPDVLFRSFMGRDPNPEALIERNLGDAA